jgi:hypothetical protein
VVAESNAAQPGVGGYRNERDYYCYPGGSLFVPQIATVGLAGGAGFTSDGFIDVHMDSWGASVASQLPPEQDIGQETDFMAAVSGIERNNPDVQSLDMNDYIAFKRLGILALRMDGGTAIFQSDVTTSLDPAQVDGFRRRFADFCEDSLADALSPFAKKPMNANNRKDALGVTVGFLNGLLSPNDPNASRIDGFSVDAKTPNTPDSMAAGVFRMLAKVRMTPNIKDIVLDIQVGTTVVIQQAA